MWLDLGTNASRKRTKLQSSYNNCSAPISNVEVENMVSGGNSIEKLMFFVRANCRSKINSTVFFKGIEWKNVRSCSV